MSAYHVPVLPRETLQYLDLQAGQTVVDGTVGAAGHSSLILKALGPEGLLIGLDRDPMMLRFASSLLSEDNVILEQASYSECSQILKKHSQSQDRLVGGVDRILLDLGLSSDQLADRSRGFGFDADGPLDLRFDTSTGIPAWQWLAETDEQSLEQILRDYGEERFARGIARYIVGNRRRQPIHTARELTQAVAAALPAAVQRKSRKQPATRVFQALRIVINGELEHLQRALQSELYASLRPSGRLVIISFHSLEDRLVKNAFRDKERWQNLTPKPITATATEQRVNPRSRSAKLRAARKMN